MKMFEQNIINLYGEKGRQWLDHLQNHVAQLANTYGLSNLKPVDNLSYNYVLSGFQGPLPIILKLGLDIDGFKREAVALMAFSSFGVVEIFSENNGFLWLECAIPGVSLKSHFSKNDDEAINITADVIKRLHKAPIPSTHAFPQRCSIKRFTIYAGGYVSRIVFDIFIRKYVQLFFVHKGIIKIFINP